MPEKLDFFDLINEYEKIFFKNGKRIWGKTSEYGGKRSMISKRVYSFNRYLRVVKSLSTSKKAGPLLAILIDGCKLDHLQEKSDKKGQKNSERSIRSKK